MMKKFKKPFSASAVLDELMHDFLQGDYIERPNNRSIDNKIWKTFINGIKESFQVHEFDCAGEMNYRRIS